MYHQNLITHAQWRKLFEPQGIRKISTCSSISTCYHPCKHFPLHPLTCLLHFWALLFGFVVRFFLLGVPCLDLLISVGQQIASSKPRFGILQGGKCSQVFGAIQTNGQVSFKTGFFVRFLSECKKVLVQDFELDHFLDELFKIFQWVRPLL